jgi:hypothetical protein
MKRFDHVRLGNSSACWPLAALQQLYALHFMVLTAQGQLELEQMRGATGSKCSPPSVRRPHPCYCNDPVWLVGAAAASPARMQPQETRAKQRGSFATFSTAAARTPHPQEMHGSVARAPGPL